MEKEKLSYAERQKLKEKYIPLCAEGKLSIRKCAEILDIAPVSVFNLKKRYIEKGNQAFVNGHKGQKRSDEKFENRIKEIYTEVYGNKDFVNENAKEFFRILNDKYKISISYTTVRRILNAIDDRDLVANKYLRSSGLDISDFNKLFTRLSKELNKSNHGIIEQYGIVYLSDLLFDKAFRCLKKCVKLKDEKTFRTSYSLFEYVIENKIIDIEQEWNYWNKEHKYFTFIYDEKILEKVFSDIKNEYFKMFNKIKLYLDEVII